VEFSGEALREVEVSVLPLQLLRDYRDSELPWVHRHRLPRRSQRQQYHRTITSPPDGKPILLMQGKRDCFFTRILRTPGA
jgi:hypothetical protein